MLIGESIGRCGRCILFEMSIVSKMGFRLFFRILTLTLSLATSEQSGYVPLRTVAELPFPICSNRLYCPESCERI